MKARKKLAITVSMATAALVLGKNITNEAAMAALSDMAGDYTDKQGRTHIVPMTDPLDLVCVFDDSSDGDSYA